MRILLVHNYYQHPGGEDSAYHREAAMLRAHGHDVAQLEEHNDRIRAMPAVSLAKATVWSRQSYDAVRRAISEHRAEIVHFHNTFPLVSPSAYYAAQRMGVPVVQSLYNPRLVCLAASLYRSGRLCTECLGRIPWPGVLHACYHGSRLQSLGVATMLTTHRWLGTWARRVSTYVVATEFYRDLMVRGGLPSAKLTVKANFVSPDPGYDSRDRIGEYALFVGRLDAEKGVRTMLAAWKELNIPLLIRGDGPLEAEARQLIRQHRLDHVRIVGRRSEADLAQLMRAARFLVWPSEGYYETFGFAAVEAFAVGTPVIASRIGVMTEIVRDDETGIHFEAGNASDLAAKSQWLWDHPDDSRRLGIAARRDYEQRFTSERNYPLLIGIYERAIAEGTQ